jgi:hypothetical protein
MNKDLSRKGKISLIIGLSSMIGLVMYIFIVMDGRTQLNSRDSWFFWSMIIIAVISVVITIADRAKTRGGEFSWKKFGIILIIVSLFGLWRLTV